MFKSLLRTLPTLSGNFTVACKLNEFVQLNSNDYETYVREGCLMPLQNSIFTKNIELNLVKDQHEYVIKQFYNNYSNVFYKENFTYNKNDFEEIDEYEVNKPNDSRNKDYEFGCKRLYFGHHNYQFSFYAPFYIDDVNDLPEYFMINVKLNDNLEKHIKVYINKNNSNNYLKTYLTKYIKHIDNKVIFCLNDSKQATYFGIDVKNGGLVKYVDNVFGDLYNNQNTINNFDYMVCKGFERNNLIMRQIIPLSFIFNINDIFNYHEKLSFAFKKMNITGYYYDNDNVKHDFYDFSIDYTDLYEKYLKYNESTGLYENDYGYDDSGNKINIMNVGYPSLNEGRYTRYRFTNKITPIYCRFKLSNSSDDHPYITNMSYGFSNLQTPNKKYGEFPTMFKDIYPMSIVKNENMYLPIGDSKITYYDTNKENIDKYIKLMSNFYSSWYNIYYENTDIFKDNTLWADVDNEYSYFRGVLYKTSKELIGEHIDRFGVFLDININYFNNKENINIIGSKYVLTYTPSNNTIEINNFSYDKNLIEDAEYNFSFDYSLLYKDELANKYYISNDGYNIHSYDDIVGYYLSFKYNDDPLYFKNKSTYNEGLYIDNFNKPINNNSTDIFAGSINDIYLNDMSKYPDSNIYTNFSIHYNKFGEMGLKYKPNLYKSSSQKSIYLMYDTKLKKDFYGSYIQIKNNNYFNENKYYDLNEVIDIIKKYIGDKYNSLNLNNLLFGYKIVGYEKLEIYHPYNLYNKAIGNDNNVYFNIITKTNDFLNEIKNNNVWYLSTIFSNEKIDISSVYDNIKNNPDYYDNIRVYIKHNFISEGELMYILNTVEIDKGIFKFYYDETKDNEQYIDQNTFNDFLKNINDSEIYKIYMNILCNQIYNGINEIDESYNIFQNFKGFKVLDNIHKLSENDANMFNKKITNVKENFINNTYIINDNNKNDIINLCTLILDNDIDDIKALTSKEAYIYNTMFNTNKNENSILTIDEVNLYYSTVDSVKTLSASNSQIYKDLILYCSDYVIKYKDDILNDNELEFYNNDVYQSFIITYDKYLTYSQASLYNKILNFDNSNEHRKVYGSYLDKNEFNDFILTYIKKYCNFYYDINEYLNGLTSNISGKLFNKINDNTKYNAINSYIEINTINLLPIIYKDIMKLDTYNFCPYEYENNFRLYNFFVRNQIYKDNYVYVDTYNLNKYIELYNKNHSDDKIKFVNENNYKLYEYYARLINRIHIDQYLSSLIQDESIFKIQSYNALEYIYVKERVWLFENNNIYIKDKYTSLLNYFYELDNEYYLGNNNVIKCKTYKIKDSFNIKNNDDELLYTYLNELLFLINEYESLVNISYTDELNKLINIVQTNINKFLLNIISNIRNENDKFLIYLNESDTVELDLVIHKKFVQMDETLYNMMYKDNLYLYLYIRDQYKSNKDMWGIYNKENTNENNCELKNIDDFLTPLFTDIYINEYDVNNISNMIQNNKIGSDGIYVNNENYFKEIDVDSYVIQKSTEETLNKAISELEVDENGESYRKYKISINDSNKMQLLNIIKNNEKYYYERYIPDFLGIDLYSLYNINNIDYKTYNNEKYESHKGKDNLINIVTDDTGKKYGFYIINIDLDNTNNTFNINNTYDISTIFKSINNKNIIYNNYVDINYVKSIFRLINPFLKINIFKKFALSIGYIMNYPNEIDINIKYAPNRINPDNESKYMMLKDNESDVLYDSIVKYSKNKKIKLLRYFGYIVPLLQKKTIINNIWENKYIYKDNNYGINKYNILYKNDINIYKYNKVYLVNQYDSINNIDVDPSYISQYEYKHFNDNYLYNLEEEFIISLKDVIDYDTLVNEYETYDKTLEIFKKYIIKTVKKQLNINIILFLFNKYKVNYLSEVYKLDSGKNKKMYRISYKFNLK